MDDVFDYSDLKACLDQVSRVREGYWSPFSVWAWIISRSNKVVAAMQLFERQEHANRGGPHTSAAWLIIDNAMKGMFQQDLTFASDELREALEAGWLSEGIATAAGSGEVRSIERPEWTGWRVSCENYGLSLLPGMYDFKWPSDSVRAAFPDRDGVSTSDVVMVRPSLPPNAKPNDHKHAEYAHQAAEILRADKSIKPETAFARVAPGEVMRKRTSIISAIRRSFELMYKPDGLPHQN